MRVKKTYGLPFNKELDLDKSNSSYENVSNGSEINSKLNHYEFAQEIKRNMQLESFNQRIDREGYGTEEPTRPIFVPSTKSEQKGLCQQQAGSNMKMEFRETLSNQMTESLEPSNIPR